MKSEDDFANEPAYQHLYEIANQTRYINPGEVRGNYYRSDAALNTHTQ